MLACIGFARSGKVEPGSSFCLLTLWFWPGPSALQDWLYSKDYSTASISRHPIRPLLRLEMGRMDFFNKWKGVICPTLSATKQSGHLPTLYTHPQKTEKMCILPNQLKSPDSHMDSELMCGLTPGRVSPVTCLKAASYQYGGLTELYTSNSKMQCGCVLLSDKCKHHDSCLHHYINIEQWYWAIEGPQTQHCNCTSNQSWPNLMWKLFKTGTNCATVTGFNIDNRLFTTEASMQGWETWYTDPSQIMRIPPHQSLSPSAVFL